MNGLQEKYKSDYKWKRWINNTKSNKPYVDTSTCAVYWGTDSEVRKEKRRQ